MIYRLTEEPAPALIRELAHVRRRGDDIVAEVRLQLPPWREPVEASPCH